MLRTTLARTGLFFLVGATALVSGCSQPAWTKPAKSGDFGEARESLKTDKVTTRRQAKQLAYAVLSYEVANAKVDYSAGIDDTSFIDSLSGCSGSTRSILSRRAEGEDLVAAQAAMVLLESGYYSDSKARSFKTSGNGAWRALAAAVSDTEKSELRKAYLHDPDTRVRLAAARAARKASAKSDAAILLEVARLDPDPLVRSVALSAIARLRVDGLTSSLVELYPSADSGEKLQIIQALANKNHFLNGGQQRLETILSSETSLNAVYAASALLSGLQRREFPVNQRAVSAEELEFILLAKQQATERLLELAAGGSSTEARAALRALPMTHREAQIRLRVAAMNEDTNIAVLALARLAGLTGAPRDTRQALLKIANSDTAAAQQAIIALAALGEPMINTYVQRLATSGSASSRRIAGGALIRLADYQHLAPLLLDKTPQVRRHVACRLLASPRSMSKN